MSAHSPHRISNCQGYWIGQPVVSSCKLSNTLFCGLWVRTHFVDSCVVVDFGLCPGWGGFPIAVQCCLTLETRKMRCPPILLSWVQPIYTWYQSFANDCQHSYWWMTTCGMLLHSEHRMLFDVSSSHLIVTPLWPHCDLELWPCPPKACRFACNFG